ncbi:hypothetical protein [Veillonella magna]|uniref:hypothetical protein n=1 Tax=Veillonella magna TaxID=464322 RepID=UPI0026DB0A7D|nr:hypothetical protein [Veillonella magna]
MNTLQPLEQKLLQRISTSDSEGIIFISLDDIELTQVPVKIRDISIVYWDLIPKTITDKQIAAVYWQRQ